MSLYEYFKTHERKQDESLYEYFKRHKEIMNHLPTAEQKDVLLAQQNELLASILEELRTARIERNRRDG